MSAAARTRALTGQMELISVRAIQLSGELDDIASMRAYCMAHSRESLKLYGVDREITRILHLHHDIANALKLADELELGEAADLNLAYACVLDLDKTLGLARDLTRTCDLKVAANIALTLGRSLQVDVDRVRRFAHGRPHSSDARQNRVAGKVASSAVGLLAIATRILPVADRPRYTEEYACELGDLVQSGARHWRQIQYAFSQLRSAPRMRFALQSPRRRGAPL